MKKENRIYCKVIGMDNWFRLKGIASMSEAIDYVRANNYLGLGSIGLSDYDGMMQNNCNWDNL